MVAACLAALSGDRHRDAVLTLRAIAEKSDQSTADSRRSLRLGRVVGSVLGVRLAARPIVSKPRVVRSHRARLIDESMGNERCRAQAGDMRL
jgi:hypothetical protein